MGLSSPDVGLTSRAFLLTTSVPRLAVVKLRGLFDSSEQASLHLFNLTLSKRLPRANCYARLFAS